MANINVVVQDANNVLLNLTPAPATTLIAEGGNNVTLELTPTPTQVISLDRGVAGNGIESISVVTIDGDQYLHIVFTNGTTSDVGPISATTYSGITPIVVNNTTNQISLDTVPVAFGGTGATTASSARANLGLGSIATQNSNSVTITGGSISGITDLAISDGGTGASTASDARTNLGLGTIATQASSAVSITGGTITGITDLAVADGGTGASTASDARTNLGLGSAAVLTAGAALGVATLDAGGTVPLSQIPASIQGGLIYQGAWNASTNTPTLTSSVGTKGYYYVVGVAGSTNLNGITDWNIGDLAVFNGSVWEQIDNTDAVTSVNGYTGAVVLNAADVGALASVTSTDGSITVSQVGTAVDLAVSAASPASTLLLQVRNNSGATMTKGTVVYVNGAVGQLPTIAKALATSDATSAQTQGLVTTDISNNSNGYVTIVGLVTGLNTSAYSDGEQLYLSGTTAGAMTGTKQYAPIHLVYVGVVTHAHPTQGKIQVKVQNGYELDELHNVSAQTPSNGQTIVYNSSTTLWESNTVSLTVGVNGTLPVTNGGTGVTTSTGSGNVVLSTSPTLVTPLLGTPTSGVLTNCTGYTYANLTGSVPTWNQNTTGTAAGLSATLAITSGGTGATTRQDAMDTLAGAVTSGYYLRGNGTDVVMSAIQAADVPTLNQNTTGTASNVTGTVAVANGGTGSTSLTANNVLLGNGTSAVQGVAPGTSGNVLTSNGTTWTSQAAAGGSGFPTGTAMLFVQTAAPTGWTKSTTHDNKALRVVTGTASSGGSVAFTTAFASQSVSGTIASTTATNQNTTATGSVSTSVSGSNTATTATGTVGSTTLSTAQMPSHNHQTVPNGASGSLQWGSGPTIAGLNASAYASGTGAYSSSTGGGGSHNHSLTMDSHNHTFSGSASSSFTGTAHTHTQDAHNHTFSGTAINLAVQYVDVIIATKD